MGLSVRLDVTQASLLNLSTSSLTSALVFASKGRWAHLKSHFNVKLHFYKFESRSFYQHWFHLQMTPCLLVIDDMNRLISARLSNGSPGANFAFRRTQNLLRGTCSENGLGANQSKYLLQWEQIFAPSSKSLDLSKWYGRAPKMHHFKVKISKFPGGGPPDPPPTPLKMVWKRPQKTPFQG